MLKPLLLPPFSRRKTEKQEQEKKNTDPQEGGEMGGEANPNPKLVSSLAKLVSSLGALPDLTLVCGLGGRLLPPLPPPPSPAVSKLQDRFDHPRSS